MLAECQKGINPIKWKDLDQIQCQIIYIKILGWYATIKNFDDDRDPAELVIKYQQYNTYTSIKFKYMSQGIRRGMGVLSINCQWQ